MITITQTLSREDYGAAAAVHYGTCRSARYRPWLAGLLMVLGAFLVATSPQRAFGFVAIAYGIFMLFRKRLWIRRVVKSAATAKQFGEEVRLEIDPEAGTISTEQGDDRSRIRMDGLVGFVRHPIGFLLYPQRNIFYHIKAEAFGSSEQMDLFQEQLVNQGVAELRK